MAEFDFGNLSVPGKQSDETDPRAILRSLPVRSGAINDLWDGQAQALTQWNDNELEIGPDVLWLSQTEKVAVGLEAKSDKTTDAYNKGDIGQAHQHIVWLADTHGDRESLGVILIGQPKSVTDGSSPSPQMFTVDRQALLALVAAYRDLREHVRADLGASRLAQVAKLGMSDEWDLRAVVKRLNPTALT